AVFALVALPWFALVLSRFGWDTTLSLWRAEVTREGATNNKGDPLWTYFLLFEFIIPWVVFFVAGLIGACVVGWRKRPAAAAAIIMLLVPLLIMTCVKDRKARYLLPMIPVAAALTAFGV